MLNHRSLVDIEISIYAMKMRLLFDNHITESVTWIGLFFR